MAKGVADNPQRLPPVHPGEVLNEEFLRPMQITQYRLAKAIGVDARRIRSIVHGQRSITAETGAAALAPSSGTRPRSGWACRASTTSRPPRTASPDASTR